MQLYYRDRGAWVAHLAVQLSQGIASGDSLSASGEEISEAKELLRRAGVRMPGEAAPPEAVASLGEAARIRDAFHSSFPPLASREEITKLRKRLFPRLPEMEY